MEYAAFFGSIDILQYLHTNKAELTESIWIYAIHSNNPEVIHFLIENNNNNNNNVYEDALIEAVKCHHNNVAEFIENNLFTQKIDLKEGQSEFNEKFFESVFQSYNYHYFPDNLKINNSFYYLNRYYYNKIVTLYFNSIKEELEAQIKDIFKFEFENKIFYKFKSSFIYFIYIKFLIIYFYDQLLIEAAEKNKIELVYYLLQEKDSIEDQLFYKNTQIKVIVLPNTIKTIGKESFRFCNYLRKVFIPSSVTQIKESAFEQCISLEEIQIPFQVTEIESAICNQCIKLTKVSIHSPVTKIHHFAFNECESLKEILIPPTVQFIGYFTFGQCHSLSQLIIPSSVKTIYGSAFRSSFEKQVFSSLTIFPSDADIQDYQTFNVENLCYNKLGKFGKQVFRSSSQIALITRLPIIPNRMFHECSLFNKIVIPSFVTEIGYLSFSSCLMTHVEIPSSVTVIGLWAFAGCVNLESAVIPPKVKTIGQYTFYDCRSLLKVSIPSSVEIFGDLAFANCIKLSEVDIECPSSLRKIGKRCFYKCLSLNNFKVPPFVTEIEDGTFELCLGLNNIEIHPSIKSIGNCAFRFTRVSFSLSNVTSLGKNIFKDDIPFNGQKIKDMVAEFSKRHY